MSDATLRKVIAGLLALFLGFALNTTRLVLTASAAQDEIQPEFTGCVKGIDCLCLKDVNCTTPYRPGKGDMWGNEYGEPADKNCPKDPVDESPLASERMHTPPPPWGRDGPLAKGYWGDTEMSIEPNMKMCEWNAEHDNKHDIMQDRCWPLWHGQRNGASDKKHTCRPA